jgi:hypothetical protein
MSNTNLHDTFHVRVLIRYVVQLTSTQQNASPRGYFAREHLMHTGVDIPNLMRFIEYENIGSWPLEVRE